LPVSRAEESTSSVVQSGASASASVDQYDPEEDESSSTISLEEKKERFVLVHCMQH